MCVCAFKAWSVMSPVLPSTFTNCNSNFHQQKKMKVLSAVPRSPACCHQHVCLLRSLCWVSRVARRLPLWMLAASRAKCFALCWMRWSPKRTSAPPNKTRRAAKETSYRKNPHSSWTPHLDSSAETSFSGPALTWRLWPTEYKHILVVELHFSLLFYVIR